LYYLFNTLVTTTLLLLKAKEHTDYYFYSRIAGFRNFVTQLFTCPTEQK